ncbi:hypothetical protein V6N11_019648 [Hibiscus sabdariffa]|uniref:Uncharacterized protein n=1 Tax=Hibiscus sabdariffa TaxID=183260 RepID=A0ABR2NLC5_9ROSI
MHRQSCGLSLEMILTQLGAEQSGAVNYKSMERANLVGYDCVVEVESIQSLTQPQPGTSIYEQSLIVPDSAYIQSNRFASLPAFFTYFTLLNPTIGLRFSWYITK